GGCAAAGGGNDDQIMVTNGHGDTDAGGGSNGCIIHLRADFTLQSIKLTIKS
ncbi:unnamed protein product, partial [Ascophyllum nodosum]